MQNSIKNIYIVGYEKNNDIITKNDSLNKCDIKKIN